MHHSTRQALPHRRQAEFPSALDKVCDGRVAEVPPDELWQIVDSINSSIATMTTLVDKIEAHLASIDYTPPGSG